MSGKNMVGKLRKAMYGTRDAPKIWSRTVRKLLLGMGFQASTVQPSLYVHFEKDIKLMVHVDDFLVVASAGACTWLHEELKKEFELSCTILGDGNQSYGKYLNRRIEWRKNGIVIAGDPKHANILIQEWGMSECAGVDTPMGRDTEDLLNEFSQIERPAMKDADATSYRRGVARVNFMAQDRPDLSVVARLMSQGMSSPKEGDEKLLKRTIRYLRRYPISESMFVWQARPKKATLNIDSDWAGDQKSRKSTSGGTIRHGHHLIQHWSKLQATIALSSGEAELNSAVKGT